MWIHSCLDNRTYRINVSSYFSHGVGARILVNHRSVLGPILILLFHNDRLEAVRGEVILFVDGVKIVACRKKNIIDIKVSFQQFWKCSADWNVCPNVNKCCYIDVSSNLKWRLSLDDDSSILKEVTETQDLVMLDDPSFKRSKHCKQAANMVRSLFLIRCSFAKLTTDTLFPL